MPNLRDEITMLNKKQTPKCPGARLKLMTSSYTVPKIEIQVEEFSFGFE